MRFRKLRIAWSVMCLIACVLLIVLLVRSYWRMEVWSRNGELICSFHGELSYVNVEPGLVRSNEPWRRSILEPITVDTKPPVWLTVDRLDIQRMGIRISTRRKKARNIVPSPSS